MPDIPATIVLSFIIVLIIILLIMLLVWSAYNFNKTPKGDFSETIKSEIKKLTDLISAIDKKVDENNKSTQDHFVAITGKLDDVKKSETKCCDKILTQIEECKTTIFKKVIEDLDNIKKADKYEKILKQLGECNTKLDSIIEFFKDDDEEIAKEKDIKSPQIDESSLDDMLNDLQARVDSIPEDNKEEIEKESELKQEVSKEEVIQKKIEKDSSINQDIEIKEKVPYTEITEAPEFQEEGVQEESSQETTEIQEQNQQIQTTTKEGNTAS